MADKKLISSSSSCTYNQPAASSSDEISLFLRHIFDRSSPLVPSYYSTAVAASATAAEINDEQHAEQRFLGSQSSLKRMIPFSAACFGNSAVAAGDGCFSGNNAPGNSSATRVTSSSIGASGNEETDEYDCESEEGVEAVVDEPPAKSGPPRSSSKRCRAAEVHNLSEKRRRSRINEKMKALQSLIPNSNKTDKASMLDEAIEYLKQLQLQVQMLTMRNGLSLHPLCLPGSTLQLPQIRPVESINESLINHTNQVATNPNPPELINTATSYTLEPAIRNHFGPFPLLTSSMEMNREEGLSLTQQRLSIGHHNTNLTGATGLFDGQETELKD